MSAEVHVTRYETVGAPDTVVDVQRLRHRLEELFRHPEDLKGFLVSGADVEHARALYGMLMGRKLAESPECGGPVVSAVSEKNPHGRHPWNWQLEPGEDLRFFHVLNNALVRPLRLERRDADRMAKTPAERPKVERCVDALMRDPANVNRVEMPFESVPTDAMTVAAYDPRQKKWVAQTLPYGELSRNGWRTVDHYSGNVITGSVAVKRRDGAVCVLRLDAHLEREVRDAAAVGLPPLDKAWLRQCVANQLGADRRWIPDADNPVGNRMYVRSTVTPENLGPKLLGPNAGFTLLSTPIGPYKVDPLKDTLKVRWMGMPRPVAEGSAKNKAGLNYPIAVGTFAPFAKMGYHEGLFSNGERGIQEATSSNLIVVLDDGRGGFVFATPDPEITDVLPGITGQSIMELAEYLGYKTEKRVVTDEELGHARAAALTGTAMHGAVQIGVIEDDSGEKYRAGMAVNDPENPLSRVQRLFDDIYHGRGPDEFRHWMEPVA